MVDYPFPGRKCALASVAQLRGAPVRRHAGDAIYAALTELDRCIVVVEEIMFRYTSHGPSILIVEDNEELLESFGKFFEMKGFAVTCACTGCEAAEKIAATDYDVAIIDITLPDMNGTALLPKFRRTMPATRKIIMTSYVTLENVLEAINNGAGFFLAKPVKPDNLLKVVNKQLEERALELQLIQRKLEEFKGNRLEVLGEW